MNDKLIYGLMAAGGALYYLESQGGGAADPLSLPPPDTSAAAANAKKRSNRITGLKAAQRGSSGPKDARLATNTTHHTNTSGFPAEVEDKIKAEMEAYWNSASGEAKTRACQAMKAQFPNDPAVQAADCAAMANAKFQAILAIAAAAAGGAICGPPCSVVGILAVSIAGPKLEEWANDAWDEIQNAGDSIGQKAEDLWNWVF